MADALSKTTHADIQELAVVSVVQPTWLLDLQTAYSTDPRSCQLLQELTVKSPSGHYSLKLETTVCRSSAEIQQKVLQVLHSGLARGHSGVEATYHRVKQLFAWPHLK